MTVVMTGSGSLAPNCLASTGLQPLRYIILRPSGVFIFYTTGATSHVCPILLSFPALSRVKQQA